MSQNATFMLDGVPFDFERSRADEQRPWERSGMTVNEWKNVASMSFQLSQIERPPLSEQSAPAFTLRIDARAKEEIRKLLEERYGYRSSTIYSDMSGLADYVAANMSAIEKKAVARIYCANCGPAAPPRSPLIRGPLQTICKCRTL